MAKEKVLRVVTTIGGTVRRSNKYPSETCCNQRSQSLPSLLLEIMQSVLLFNYITKTKR